MAALDLEKAATVVAGAGYITTLAEILLRTL